VALLLLLLDGRVATLSWGWDKYSILSEIINIE
jgi:hypothetical protein